MGSEPAATIVSSVSLPPAQRVDPVKYELTAFDQSMRFALYQKRVLFFSTSLTSQEFSSLVHSLEKSLAGVLVWFHPLCGRIRVGDNPLLELDCSGELSVRFSEAHTQLSIEELKATSFEPSVFNDSLCELGCSPKYPWDPQVPLLFVQLTRFACGGFSIGIGFSHQACDGVSAWQFMNSWAEFHRTGKLVETPVVSYQYDEWKNLSDEQLNESAQKAGYPLTIPDSPSQDSLAESKVEMHNPGNLKLGVKNYKVDKVTIETLKSQAKIESSKTFTSYEILCAHFWRKMVAASELCDQDKCYLAVLINCRGRIKSIPKNYFGNAIGSLLVTSKLEDLRQDENLFNTAQVIHDGITTFDEATAQGSIQFMNKILSSNRWESAQPPKTGQYTLVVSSPRHPVYECDFGFGRPAGVTFGMNDLGDAKLYLFPPSDAAGGVDVTVSMPVNYLHNLH